MLTICNGNRVIARTSDAAEALLITRECADYLIYREGGLVGDGSGYYRYDGTDAVSPAAYSETRLEQML